MEVHTNICKLEYLHADDFITQARFESTRSEAEAWKLEILQSGVNCGASSSIAEHNLPPHATSPITDLTVILQCDII